MRSYFLTSSFILYILRCPVSITTSGSSYNVRFPTHCFRVSFPLKNRFKHRSKHHRIRCKAAFKSSHKRAQTFRRPSRDIFHRLELPLKGYAQSLGFTGGFATSLSHHRQTGVPLPPPPSRPPPATPPGLSGPPAVHPKFDGMFSLSFITLPGHHTPSLSACRSLP